MLSSVPTMTPKKRGLLHGNLGVMMISSGFWNFGGQMTMPFWALYVLQLGGSYFDIGLLSALSSILIILPSLFGGYLADTLGRKRMIYTLSFILSFNTLVYALAPSWHWLALGIAVDSIAAGLRTPAFNAIIADSINVDSRAEGFALMNVGHPIFGIFSPYIIGIFMDSLGVVPAQRYAYLILFSTSFVASMMRFKLLTETLKTEKKERIKPSRVLLETFSGIRSTFKVFTRQLWILTCMGMLLGLSASIGASYWAPYATVDVIHLSNSEWGLITTIGLIVNIAISIPLARLADRKGRVKMVLPSIMLAPLAIIAFIYSTSFQQVLVLNLVITILGCSGAAASQALFTDHSPREHRGRMSSLSSVLGTIQTFSFTMMGGSVLGASGNLLGGYLYGNFSMAAPLFLEAGLIALSAIIGLIFLREPKKRAE